MPLPAPLARRLCLLLTAAMLFAAACTAKAEPTEPFFDGSVWHDGQAEVNFYAASEIRYEERRPADEAVLIFVKEDHHADRLIKADDPAEGDLPAVKLNWVSVIPTGMYTYRQQASVFLNRRTNRPFRETFASHEWCGNVFKDLRTREPGRWQYEWKTYFEDDGEGEKRLDTEQHDRPVIPADALPAYVRTARRNHDLALLPSLRTIRAEADAFEPTAATLRFTGDERITVPAGTFAVERIVVSRGDDAEDVFHIEAGPRRRLIRMHLADGARYELKHTTRTDYWNRNAPSDQLLP